MNLPFTLDVQRTLTIALVGTTALLLSFGLAAAPSRPGNRLGLRGLKRQRALASSPVWRLLEPLVRWLGVRLSGVIPETTRARLDAQLSLAGDVLGLTADEYVATSLMSTVGGFCAAWAVADVGGLGINMALVLCVPTSALLPYLQVSGRAQERLASISRGLPFVIDLLAMAMSAGVDFPGAVRQVVEKAPRADDPTIEELSLILQGIQIGRSRREVLQELARRAPCEAVLEFTGAVIQAEQRGNPLAEVLLIQATTYRTRRSVNAEEAAAKAGVQMTAPLLLVFVSVILLVVSPMILKVTSME